MSTRAAPQGRQDQHRRNLDYRRARRRTPKYLELMKKLDTSAALDPSELQQLVDDIGVELGELGLLEFPLGIVAECFLGPPYRVHVIDLSGMIVEHFEGGRSMPAPFESARSLALHCDYAAVEVYPSQLIPLAPNGAGSPIPL